MELIDPTVEMSSDALRKVIEHCIEYGRTLIGYHGGDDRMAERGFTGAEIQHAAEGASRDRPMCRWEVAVPRNPS